MGSYSDNELVARDGFVYCCPTVFARAQHESAVLSSEGFGRRIMERRRFLVGHCASFRRAARSTAPAAVRAQRQTPLAAD